MVGEKCEQRGKRTTDIVAVVAVTSFSGFSDKKILICGFAFDETSFVPTFSFFYPYPEEQQQPGCG